MLSPLKEEQSKQLAMVYNEWKNLYENGNLSGPDLVGGYILAWVAMIHGPKKCLAGPIRPCLYLDRDVMNSLRNDSKRIVNFPFLRQIFRDETLRVAARWCGVNGIEDLTIGLILNHIRLYAIQQNKKDCVNIGIIEWILGHRPFDILFTIPEPIEVLRMQAHGRRVISVLVKEEELQTLHSAKLLYMESEPYNHKDANEFLCHDLRHMEHFAGDSLFYEEQVGLFYALYYEVEPIQNDLRSFFDFYSCGDVILWHQLEYAISDMNSVCRHILQYIKAKWMMRDEHLEQERNGVMIRFDSF